MINQTVKTRIVDTLRRTKKNYKNQTHMARAFGINPAQLSRLLNNDTEQVVSDATLTVMARKMGVMLNDYENWITAKTQTFQFIWQQLEACQEFSLSGILCDIADIGKTYTAKKYVSERKNAIYIDCSQVKNKQRLTRKLASEFGLNNTGRYADVYEDLIFYLRSSPSPLIVLDEAGDLNYLAFLELKALWNATERAVGWYMMGADGLKVKIERNKDLKKVGYAELFSRYGSRYQQISPLGRDDMEEFKKKQIASIAVANGRNNIQEMYAKTQGSLRRLFIEIQKTK